MSRGRRLSTADYNLMEQLMLYKQGQIKKFLAKVLRNYYSPSNLVVTDEYIFAKGDIPIAVAAHMDTVWETHTSHQVFYDNRKNMMINLNGGGYDDKVGIFLILKLLEEGFRPHVIFCTDEEVGSLGAEQLIKDCPKSPFKDCRFIIMLDRRGKHDCVFYDCDNEEFVAYIEKFGFKEAWGSFTDICTLCPAWGMAGVNLSVGYDNEHTANEVLYVGTMFRTLEKVKKILLQPDEEIIAFKYIPSRYYGGYNGHYLIPYLAKDWYKDDDDDDIGYKYSGYYYADTPVDHFCCKCGKKLVNSSHNDWIDVLEKDGSVKYFCEACAYKYLDFCDCCGEAYEVNPKHPEITVCPQCMEAYGITID